jgi:hypothetical protein
VAGGPAWPKRGWQISASKRCCAPDRFTFFDFSISASLYRDGEDAMDINNFQRVGSVSNAHAGNDFESLALIRNFAAPVRVGEQKKWHRFDLGSEKPPVLVECKSHTWTQGGKYGVSPFATAVLARSIQA